MTHIGDGMKLIDLGEGKSTLFLSKHDQIIFSRGFRLVARRINLILISDYITTTFRSMIQIKFEYLAD